MPMKVVLSALLLCLFAGTACQRSPVLAKVGGKSIRQSDLDIIAEINPRLKPRLATPAGRQKILENYVEQTLLYREAVRRGLNRAEGTKLKLDLYEKIVIAQSLLDDELNRKVKEYYDNHRDEFERVKVSHILIRTMTDPLEEKPDPKKGPRKPQPKRPEAEAQKMIAKIQERLAKGEDFGKLAADLSEDKKTNKNQGDLGLVTLRDKRLERQGWLTLAENAFALKEGEVSQPVKTNDGFHLVKVVEAKKAQLLEEADAGIRFRIQADMRNTLLNELKSKYKVVYTQEKKEEPVVPSGMPIEGMNPAPAAPTPPAPPAGTPGPQS